MKCPSCLVYSGTFGSRIRILWSSSCFESLSIFGPLSYKLWRLNALMTEYRICNCTCSSWSQFFGLSRICTWKCSPRLGSFSNSGNSVEPLSSSSAIAHMWSPFGSSTVWVTCTIGCRGPHPLSLRNFLPKCISFFSCWCPSGPARTCHPLPARNPHHGRPAPPRAHLNCLSRRSWWSRWRPHPGGKKWIPIFSR